MLEVAADGGSSWWSPLSCSPISRGVLVEKLGLGIEAVEQLRALLDELPGDTVPTPISVADLSGDPDDDRILAAAKAADAEILVSGDSRHLLPLGEVAGMRILRPQDLLAELPG